jgi:hypothetical protein
MALGFYEKAGLVKYKLVKPDKSSQLRCRPTGGGRASKLEGRANWKRKFQELPSPRYNYREVGGHLRKLAYYYHRSRTHLGLQKEHERAQLLF